MIIASEGAGSVLKKAVGSDWKGKLSLALYLVAIVTSVRSSWAAQAIYVSVALIWLIPDRRIKRVLARRDPLR